MDTAAKEKKNQKRGLITKTWERCKSFGRGGSDVSSSVERRGLTKKSNSWHSPSSTTSVPSRTSSSEDHRQSDSGDDKIHRSATKHKHRVAPEGCFSVYVGPEKQRFVIRTEHANHPLFRVLLEEAETEYGYSSNGPLELPCGVDVFRRVLLEMDSDDRVGGVRQGCGFVHGGVGGHTSSAYRLSRMMAINQF